MCCFSFIGQVIYGCVMLVALGFTIAAMFTPGWTDIKDKYKNITDDAGHPSTVFKDANPKGIFNFFCKTPDSNDVTYDCKSWFHNLPAWQRAVVACMCLALITELIALAWCVFTICACCCKQFLLHPLILLAMLLSAFLAIAIIIFAIQHKHVIQETVDDLYDKGKDKTQLGYSFYLACVSLGLALADVVVGSLTLSLAKHCL